MQCPSCHAENRGDRRFCSKCGSPLALACGSCGFTNDPGDEFCGGCGARLGTSSPTTARFATPDSYTPKHLADKILNSKAALEGERKQVTVLFADLKGSMELLADRDLEEARKILDAVVERMMEAVHRYEGTVNQVMGDGIMALFGAPLAHEDHAVRACYAALRMQESVRRYAEEVRRSAGAPIAIRVGLNSGEVVVRSIGSDLRMDYTAVGQTTHLAARMEQTALPGSVLLTAATLGLAEGYVAARAMGPVPVKGLADPVEVFELTGVGAARSRLQARVPRGLSRFVGRGAELDSVIQALERVRSGHGQVVALVGEPGVGKSRLVWELTHSRRVHDWLVLGTASLSHGQATPYLPVIELLRAYFHIEDRDSAQSIRERVTGKVLALDRALESSLPALLALLDALPEDEQWTVLDVTQRRQRTLDALRRLVLRESQVQPVLLVFEDVHWIDGETQSVLDALIEGLAPAGVLLLLTFRPEYEHRWASRTSVTQLRLDPLPGESTRELLDALLGGHTTLDALKALLAERTSGNPLFLEEIVRSLVESGTLAGDAEGYRLTRMPDAKSVPPTVQAVLASRIDRLAPEDKRLLQTAAVIGKDVPVGILAELAATTENALREGIGRLEAAEFLYEVRLFPDPEYTFKHALTLDVAYGSLLQDRRRALHAAIVEAVEHQYAGRLAEHTERLTHHAIRGEQWDKAAAYALQAARRAMDRSATLEGREYADQGLAATNRLAPSRETLETAVDLGQVLLTALFALGETEQLLAGSEAMLANAERLGDERRLSRAQDSIANTLWQLGQYHRALPILEAALPAAERIRDQVVQILVGLDLGQVHRSMGNYRRGVEILDRVIGQLVGPLATDRMQRTLYPFVTTSNALSFCLSELGELERAGEVGNTAVMFAEPVQHRASLAVACVSATHPLLLQGRFEEAIPLLERALEIYRQSGMHAFYSEAALGLGMAHAASGRFPPALALVKEAVERASQTSPRHHGRTLIALAEVHVLAGTSNEAHGAAQQAIEIARQRGERGTEARGLLLLAAAEHLQRHPDLQAVESGYRETLGLAAELGMRPLVAHCHLGLGKLFASTGKREQAREYLTTATTMYREMDMRYWLDQAEQESRQIP